MNVLIDTHIVIGLVGRDLPGTHPKIATLLVDQATIGFVSVASFWEIAIKTRLGKLSLGLPLDDLAGFLGATGLTILPIEFAHVVATLDPLPATSDPFDRLLLAQCQVEGLKLVTLDRALVSHPLAWRG